MDMLNAVKSMLADILSVSLLQSKEVRMVAERDSGNR